MRINYLRVTALSTLFVSVLFTTCTTQAPPPPSPPQNQNQKKPDCQNGKIAFEEFCLDECPLNFFEVNRQCQRCTRGCQECDNPKTCKKCDINNNMTSEMDCESKGPRISVIVIIVILVLIIFFLVVVIVLLFTLVAKGPKSARRIGNLTPIYPALPAAKFDEEGNVIPSLVEIDMKKGDIFNPFEENQKREEIDKMSYIEGSKPIQRLKQHPYMPQQLCQMTQIQVRQDTKEITQLPIIYSPEKIIEKRKVHIKRGTRTKSGKGGILIAKKYKLGEGEKFKIEE